MSNSVARQKTRDALLLIKQLYSGKLKCTTGAGSSGGHMHIVLEDGNLSIDNIAGCIADAIADGCSACEGIGFFMFNMPMPQRRHIYRTTISTNGSG